MKPLIEIWNDLPVDHLLTILLFLLAVGYCIWALLFDPDKEPAASKPEAQYLVEPPKSGMSGWAVTLLFCAGLACAALLVFSLISML